MAGVGGVVVRRMEITVLEKEKNNNAPKDIHALILKTCENVPLPCYKHMTKEMLQM